MLKPDILRRIEPTGVINRMRTAQNSVMNSLLQSARMDRMVEQVALDANAYSPTQLLADVRKGVFAELATPAKPIDTFRRNTQRVYLDVLDNRLNGAGTLSDELRAIIKGELRGLRTQIVAAIPAATDVATKRHLEDARDQIDETLDPKAQRTRGAAGAAGALGGRGGAAGPVGGYVKFDYENDPWQLPLIGCWETRTIK
jgi:hypothetical protein